ncbi:MAG TPA: UBP-type zinc finger domain-containing protein [Xanthobacteraceae bacterium]|nr:UBP-type zinc finger domain-containing protein [Xanthobacteraceae bacterium]
MSTRETVRIDSPCAHVSEVRLDAVERPVRGCEECLKLGSRWVALRTCLTCGHVGCCDSSPHRHATAHFRETGHPIMTSAEPGQSWVWCYVDEKYISR